MAQKKKIKIVKEFVNTQFKEIKPDEEPELDFEEAEEKGEKGEEKFGREDGFVSTGASRTAPVLQTENPDLESVAETAPRTAARNSTETNTAGRNPLYAAETASNYGNTDYSEKKYDEPEKAVIRQAMRPAGLLNEPLRDITPIILRQDPRLQQQAGQEAQNLMPESEARRAMVDEKKYETIDESFKKKLPFERKRRMQR